jgi:hypothetical protein
MANAAERAALADEVDKNGQNIMTEGRFYQPGATDPRRQ